MLVSELLFPNQYRRKVLALLLMRPDSWLHLRELARLTAASPGTLKKELDALHESGLLRARKVGNQMQFSANTEHPAYPELSGLIRKTTGLKDVLASALQPLASKLEQVFVFGSTAAASENAQSDVDVMLLGDATFAEVIQALYDTQAVLGREINPKVMTRAEWLEKKASHSPFVQEIMTKPKLFILGDEHGL